MKKRSGYMHLLLATVVWATCAEGWSQQSGPGAQKALFCSPVNATWAANHAKQWIDKGFDGFLFSGFSQGAEGKNGLSGVADAASVSLVREMRLAHQRLCESKIGENFLFIQPGAEDAYFVSSSAAGAALENMSRAGRLCAAIGLRGLALDCASSSGYYDYRWDGYGYDSYTPEDLLAGARRFGRSLAWSFLHQAPGSDILLIYDGLAVSGPLWLPFFEGILEAAERDNQCRVHLLTRETFYARTARDLCATTELTRRVLTRRLGGTLRGQKLSLAAGLSPLGYDPNEGKPLAHQNPVQFRELAAAAKVCSDDYIWVESDGACWWQLTDQDVQTYSSLLQNGHLAHQQARPIAANLDEYRLSMPWDEWRHAGSLEAFGAPCEVYAHEESAALVFYGGLASDIDLPAEKTLSITYLGTGISSSRAAKDGKVTLAASPDPLLVDGLATYPWVAQAGLNVLADRLPTPASQSGTISCEFFNGALTSRAGQINLLAPPELNVNPASFNFELGPGEGIVRSSTIRTKLKHGERQTVNVALSLAGAGTITTSVEVGLEPDIVWSAELDGAPAGVAVGDLDGGPGQEVITATAAGEAVAFSAQGGILWKRRFNSRFLTPPRIGTLPSGGSGALFSNSRGLVELIDKSGATLCEIDLHAACPPPGPIFANVDSFAGDEVVALAGGQVVALDWANHELWRHTPQTPIEWLGAAGAKDGKDVPVGARATAPGLVGPVGVGILEMPWIPATTAPRALLPCLADINSDGLTDVAAVASDGVAIAWDAKGARLASVETGLAAPQTFSASEGGVLLTNAGGIHFFDWEGRTRWTYECKPAGTPAIWGKGLVCGAISDGEGLTRLVCLAGGRVLWQTSEPVATATPAIADLDADGAPECIFATADCRLVVVRCR